MKIETKYNIGDEVWVLDFFDQPHKGEILSISTFNNAKVKERNYISYYIHPVGTKIECEVFPTKEELIKSLKDDIKDE
jgi:hypothetical protein